jgi:hypothetical protein
MLAMSLENSPMAGSLCCRCFAAERERRAVWSLGHRRSPLQTCGGERRSRRVFEGFAKNHNVIVLLRMMRGNVAAVWNPLTTDGDSGIGCVVAV